MRRTLAFIAFAFCASASAQGVYKCKDKAGKISYIQQECVEAGLMPGGEMKETNISPAQKPPPPPVPTPEQRQAAQKKPATIAETPKTEPAEDSANPNRRCFTVNLGKGKTATRCNDKPEPDPAEQKAEQK